MMPHWTPVLVLILSVLPAAAADGARKVGFDLHNNVIFVKASIANSEPLEFALDSGTARTTLDETVAAKLGLDLSMKAKSSSATGIRVISVIKDLTLHLGGVDVTEPLMLAYPLDFLSERLGRRVDGIIGIELFRKYVVEIDYPSREIQILPSETFAYAGPGEAVPVTFNRGLPILSGSVTPFGRGSIPARFQVDTGGAKATVMFWKAFVEKYDLAAGAQDVRETEVTSFGGTTTQKQGRVQALQIGTIVVKEPEVGLNDYQYGDANVFDGNLGTAFLKQFRLIFDLPHNRLILERPAEL